ncbi:MAG TPA: hypothetical protein VFI10_01150 [Gaiellaceae bacterium]|nr:hypothetical protein [Gaiellaceae bacterium]
MNLRSASEWRDFWRDRGERELAALLDEYEPHATRVATLLGSRASRDALAAELARIREHELRQPPDARRDAELADRVSDWFESS